MSQPKPKSGQSKFMEILKQRSQVEQKTNPKTESEKDDKHWMKKVFGFTKRIAPEDIPEIDIKGKRYKRQPSVSVPPSQIERQLFQVGK